MSFVKTSLFFCLFVFIVMGCSKTDTLIDPPVNPPPTPNTSKPTGTIYMNVVGDFIKINANDSTILWTTYNRNLFGSAGNPITIDSTTFYYGNNTGLTAYSTLTGTPRWYFSWIAFSDALSYRQPAFQDSLVFVAIPTSVWDHGYLYCLNKSTGAVLWRKEIDKGYVDRPFNTTPMVMNGKVIVLTRDAANHTQLSAFSTNDASPAWTSAINDSLSFNLIYTAGKIYSRSHRNLYCYNASDGTLAWQTDLQQPSFKDAYTFFEGDKLILVKVESHQYTIVTLNASTGNITKTNSITVPTQLPDAVYVHRGCNYANNTFYVTSAINMDTVGIKAFDLSTASIKWERRFANYYSSWFNPVLTDKYLIFPINSSYPEGKSFLYFMDLKGKDVSTIPFNANYTDGLVYIENVVMYKQEELYSNR